MTGGARDDMIGLGPPITSARHDASIASTSTRNEKGRLL
jgi:hypothetical protein